jgi:hypothetical protein
MLSHTRLDLRGLKFRLTTFITVFQNLLIPESLEMCPGALILGAACLEATVRLSWHCSSYSVVVFPVECSGTECGQQSGLLVRRRMFLFLKF